MSLKMKIMLRAVRIRMGAGEDLETILAAYPRLTGEEKELLRREVGM